MQESDSNMISTPRKPSSGKRLKIIGGAAIIVLTVAYLVLSAAKGSAAYYMTVEELFQKGASERSVRVAGLIVDGSINWRDRDLVLEFQIADDSGTLAVTYHGPRPDMLKDGAEVVVEGKYVGAEGFDAQTLMLKCPSKYEEAARNG